MHFQALGLHEECFLSRVIDDNESDANAETALTEEDVNILGILLYFGKKPETHVKPQAKKAIENSWLRHGDLNPLSEHPITLTRVLLRHCPLC